MQSLNQIAQYMLGLYVREREHNRFLVKHKLTFAWITREHNRVKINEIGGGERICLRGEKNHCKSASLHCIWWVLADNHRKYAAIYQTPELMRENCAYISKRNQHITTPWQQPERLWQRITYQNFTLSFSVSFPVKKWRKVKVTLTLSHILCYIWTILACTVTSSIHFKQVHASDSSRTRGTHLMNDSFQMIAPAQRVTI